MSSFKTTNRIVFRKQNRRLVPEIGSIYLRCLMFVFVEDLDMVWTIYTSFFPDDQM